MKKRFCLYCDAQLREVKRMESRDATPEELAIIERHEAAAEKRREELRARGAWEAADRVRASASVPGGKVLRRRFVGDVGTGRWGYGGEGVFCTLRCGYEFGLLMAREGQRILRNNLQVGEGRARVRGGKG